MNYENKIDELMKENMSERGYRLWIGIKKILPDAWQKPTSSTGKYHLKENGSMPTNAHHTFEMLYVSVRLFKVYDIKKNSSKSDMILFAIGLHDVFKYGPLSTRKHTDVTHDKQIADVILRNKSSFLKLMNEEEFHIMEQMTRFHSGRWSTDIGDMNKFKFEDFPSEILFIHTLDMLSTNDMIKIWKKDLGDT